MKRELKFKIWNPELQKMDKVEIESYLGFHGIAYDRVGCNNSDNVWMQYTGLKDKNGKDIYEGDVRRETIENNNGDDVLYYVCVYVKELCRFGWLSMSEYDEYLDTGIEHFEDTELLGMDESEVTHYVICGNIYENIKYLISNL